MTMDEPRTPAPLFTQVDIAAGSLPSEKTLHSAPGYDQTMLLRDLVAGQDRQNELLEELVNQLGKAVAHFSSGQRQRSQELAQWREANPELARNCRHAAEALSRVQAEFLQLLTEEVRANADVLADGEFLLTEFVDRFGPRLAHLNGVLQVLAQLGSAQASEAKSS
jgi:hypothetical protein